MTKTFKGETYVAGSLEDSYTYLCITYFRVLKELDTKTT